jgi:uncharacterized membrane protein YdcZ (DUF606 family)
MKTLGIVLVVLGIVMMVITGVNVVTKKKVVDVGPLEINKEKRTPINWSPIIGVALLVGGIAVMAADKKKA